MEKKIDFITFELIKKGLKNPRIKDIICFSEKVLHIKINYFEAEFIQAHYNF